MATGHENLAEKIYVERPISNAILRAIGNSPTALFQVVSETGYPREEVATWLLDMETNGLISHSIKRPNDKAEAVFSLSPKGRSLSNQLGSTASKQTRRPTSMLYTGPGVLVSRVNMGG